MPWASKKKKFPAYNLLFVLLAERIKNIRKLEGDPAKVGDYATEVVVFRKLLLVLSEQMIIPEEHFEKVTQSLHGLYDYASDLSSIQQALNNAFARHFLIQEEKRLPAHELLPKLLAEALENIKTLRGDLARMDDYTITIAGFHTLLRVLTEMVIPGQHIDEVIRLLNDLRVDLVSCDLEEKASALGEAIKVLEQSKTDQGDG